MPRDKSLNRIKSGLLSRSLSLAKISISAGAKLAAHGVTQTFKSESEREETWRTFMKEQFQSLTNELGELKGSLMKAGQMLSIYGEHFFPPEANQFLRSLHQDTPPLKWDVMKKILIEHLGKEKYSQLEVDTNPIGTASLGQVHKAKILSTGEIIALKIQYPHVDKAIDSDLKAIKSILSVLKLLPKDFNTVPIFSEIREMLVQETDYEQEAYLTEAYRDLLASDPRFVVPKVYREFSNRRIIATSFESGVRVDNPLISNLAQDRRNRLALAFMELYFKEIFEWKFVQTDPHFGNYKIRLQQDGQDQIILYDFGATRKYSDDFMIPYHRMIASMFYNDREGFEVAARELQLLKENDSNELRELFSEMCFDLVEPFLDPKDPRNMNGLIQDDGTYDWKETDLPQRSSKKIIKLLQKFHWRVPPRELIFLDRKAAGVFIFLAHLRAHVKGRDLLAQYLEPIRKKHNIG